MTIHTRYYRNADITLQVNSDLPFKSDTFDRKFEKFRVEEPGEDLARIHHHFSLPEIDLEGLGKPAYHKAPWSIYPSENGWTYVGILPEGFENQLWKVARFNNDHTIGHIYHPGPESWLLGNWHSLTTFPSDQIWLARLLADRGGCYLHSAGAIINGKGFLFVGHSDAGKSTTTQMLINASQRADSPLEVDILCDDRNIVCFRPEGWRVYGSWSHGDIPLVSAASAPLQAVCFLEQAQENQLIALTDRREILKRLLACLIKPFPTADWWGQTLDMLEDLAGAVPTYRMRFDTSGEVVKMIAELGVVKTDTNRLLTSE